MIVTDYEVNGRRSIKQLHTGLKHLRGFFGQARALDITTDRLTRYMAYRQQEGAANSSKNRRVSTEPSMGLCRPS